MKITGHALYLKWNDGDRDRWNALGKGQAKWDALAEAYGTTPPVNVTEMVQEREGIGAPRGLDWPLRGSSNGVVDVTDRVITEKEPERGEDLPEGTIPEWSAGNPNPTDEEIADAAAKSLKEGLISALEDPEVQQKLMAALFGWPITDETPEPQNPLGAVFGVRTVPETSALPTPDTRETDVLLFGH